MGEFALVIGSALVFSISVFMGTEFIQLALLKRRHKIDASELLEYILKSPCQGNVPGIVAEWRLIALGDIYRRYMAGLPVYRKIDIIDTILSKHMMRSNKNDLPSIVGMLHDVEIETIASICCEGRTFNNVADVRAELPNAILAYRFAHPLNEHSVPVMQPGTI